MISSKKEMSLSLSYFICFLFMIFTSSTYSQGWIGPSNQSDQAYVQIQEQIKNDAILFDPNNELKDIAIMNDGSLNGLQKSNTGNELILFDKYDKRIPDAFRNLADRKYVRGVGIDLWRNNLEFLVGQAILKLEDKEELSARQFIKDSISPKVFIPTNGKLKSIKITNKDSKSFSFLFSGSIENEEVLEFYISDISRVVIDDSTIDFASLKEFKNKIKKDIWSGGRFINAVTVTEIYSRKYRKSGKKLKAENVPALGTVISLGGEFYTTYEDFERQYLIGFATTSLQLMIPD